MIFNHSLLQKIGIYQYGFIQTTQITFLNEVRGFCEGNVCRHYGTTWACPPAVGTVDECRKRSLSYSRALVFNAKYNLEDSFDYEGMMIGHREFKKVCNMLAKSANINYINGENTVTYFGLLLFDTSDIDY